VKPDKAQQIGDMIIQAAQRGQIVEKVGEERLKKMLADIGVGDTKPAKIQV
jgi:DNA-binding TFAR19-related protein (PDSD5 family)